MEAAQADLISVVEDKVCEPSVKKPQDMFANVPRQSVGLGNSEGFNALVDPVQPVGNLLQVAERQLELYIFFIYSGFLP